MTERTSGTAAKTLADNRIVVVVQGGAVQHVFGVPKGFGLEVHDYDVDGCDEDDLETNDDGDRFIRAVWSEPGADAVSGDLLQLCEEAQTICQEAADWISGEEAYDAELVAGSLRKMAQDLEAALATVKSGAA